MDCVGLDGARDGGVLFLLAEKFLRMDVHLQEILKKDPQNYSDVFFRELQRMKGLMEISRMDPGEKSPDLCSLLVFLSSVSHNYPSDISAAVFSYVLGSYQDMDKSLRQSSITALIHLKKKKLLGPELLFYQKTFPLVEEMDSRTKVIFVSFLLKEIERDREMWPAIKEMLLSAAEGGNEALSKRASYIYIALSHRGCWRTAEDIKHVFGMLVGPYASTVKFLTLFLLDKTVLSVEEQEREGGEKRPAPSNKKGGSKIKRESKADIRQAERLRKKEEKEERQSNLLLLLEKVGEKEGLRFLKGTFEGLKRSKLPLALRLSVAQVVARVVCHYQTYLKGFLTFMTRFMFPHQKLLPLALTAVVQSVNDGTDAGELEGICNLIVDNFCEEYCDDEIIAYGINAIGQLFKRSKKVGGFGVIARLVNYRKSKKRQAITASAALKKLLAGVGAGAEEEEGESGAEEEESEGGEEEEEEAREDGKEFITEHVIADIRRRKNKQVVIERVREGKRVVSNNKKNPHASTTNKDKQKDNNYTVRRKKRRVQGKKLSSRTKRVKKGGKKR